MAPHLQTYTSEEVGPMASSWPTWFSPLLGALCRDDAIFVLPCVRGPFIPKVPGSRSWGSPSLHMHSQGARSLPPWCPEAFPLPSTQRVSPGPLASGPSGHWETSELPSFQSGVLPSNSPPLTELARRLSPFYRDSWKPRLMTSSDILWLSRL